MRSAITWLVSTRPRLLAVVLIAFAAAAGSVVWVFICYGYEAASLLIGGYGLLIGALGVAVAVWKPFAARPELGVALYQDGVARDSLDVGPKRQLRPIDHERIVNDEVAAARASVPPRPQESGLDWLQFGTPRESYETALTRFNEVLTDYVRHLRAWLHAYESRRARGARYLEACLHVRNKGRAPAQSVRIRLALPHGVRVPRKAPTIPAPPRRPRFERRMVPFITPPIARLPALDGEEPLGRIGGPTYLTESGTTVAEFSAANLTHGVHDISAYPLRLLMAQAGSYDIEWEAHANNMPTSQRGILTVTVRDAVTAGEPYRTLRDVLSSRDLPVVSDD